MKLGVKYGRANKNQAAADCYIRIWVEQSIFLGAPQKTCTVVVRGLKTLQCRRDKSISCSAWHCDEIYYS